MARRLTKAGKKVLDLLKFLWNGGRTTVGSQLTDLDVTDGEDRRKLVVGLGNPGRKYAETRHNVGFEVVAQVAKNYDAKSVKKKFNGELAEVRVGDNQVLLLCPHTYMNSSGSSVKPAVDFYKLPTSAVMVVCDDLALDLGRLRFRPKGSSGDRKDLETSFAASARTKFRVCEWVSESHQIAGMSQILC